MDDSSSSRGSWRPYGFLLPLLLISFAFSYATGLFDQTWTSPPRRFGAKGLPNDFLVVYALGRTMRWTPVALILYWFACSLPWTLGRWVSQRDTLVGISIVVFLQLLVTITYLFSSTTLLLRR